MRSPAPRALISPLHMLNEKFHPRAHASDLLIHVSHSLSRASYQSSRMSRALRDIFRSLIGS